MSKNIKYSQEQKKHPKKKKHSQHHECVGRRCRSLGHEGRRQMCWSTLRRRCTITRMFFKQTVKKKKEKKGVGVLRVVAAP